MKDKLVTVIRDNKVDETLDKAKQGGYDSVFIVGSKSGKLNIWHSGYNDIERKLGAMVLLMAHMVDGE